MPTETHSLEVAHPTYSDILHETCAVLKNLDKVIKGLAGAMIILNE